MNTVSDVPDDLSASWLCTALMRIGTRMATHFDQHFAEFRITQAQFRVLLAIHDADTTGVAPSVLADLLLIERATISVLTNRMVERGFLHRLPGANRRTFHLALTEEGAKLLHQLLPAACALADHTLQGLTPTKMRDMQQSLAAVEQHLRSAARVETKQEAKGDQK